MRTLSTIAELRAALDEVRAGGGTVGLVPTMGYLHEGHGSLIESATADTDLVVTTIFVNPLQFAAGEDLSAYPRDLERDTALAESCGAGLLFTPEVAEMYPEPVQTTVSGFESSTNHWTASIWMSPAPATKPAGRSTPQISTAAGSPQA